MRPPARPGPLVPLLPRRLAWLGALVAIASGCAIERDGADAPSIRLGAGQYVWVSVAERERLACADGTAVLCRGGHGRASVAQCGCSSH